MRYYKITSEDEVIAIGTGPGGVEITEAEYNALTSKDSQTLYLVKE